MANKYIDSTLLDKAIIFAVNAHKNSERRGKGFPYIVHPMEAVSIVSTITKDQELLAAAALHDTVEDTDVTVEQIRAEFGDRIAKLVDAESDKFEAGVSEEDSWHSRKQQAIDRLAKASYDTKIVAIGDKLSNMRAIARDYAEKGDTFWNIFHCSDPVAHEWHYRGLANSLGELSDTSAFSEFVQLIQQVFNPTNSSVKEVVKVNMDDYVESGAGFTATTYNHKEKNKMIKLYNTFVDPSTPIREMMVGKKINEMGINCPEVIGLVSDGERTGVEFQRIIKKRSFARAISNEPERLEEFALRFAQNCKKLHSTRCDLTYFPNIKEFFYGVVSKTTLLNNEQKCKVKAFIASVPQASTCLHGDLHFGNIITDGQNDYWIDTADFRYGNPLFDMGMLYIVCNRNPEYLTKELYHISNAQAAEFWKFFVKEYAPEYSLDEFNRKVLPFAALMMIFFCERIKMNKEMADTIKDGLAEIL